MLVAVIALPSVVLGVPNASRPPLPPSWSDLGSIPTPQFFSSAQAVCDARRAVINWQQPLTFNADQQASWRGHCTYVNGLGETNNMGNPFFGSQCPDGYWMVDYVDRVPGPYGMGYIWYGPNQHCEAQFPILDRYHGGSPPRQCSATPTFGHPIQPLTGIKVLREEFGSWRLGGQRLTLSYDSRSKVAANDASLVFNETPPASFGPLWHGSFHKRLVQQRTNSIGPSVVLAARGNGQWTSFLQPPGGGAYTTDADVADSLMATASGWRYVDVARQTQEDYDGQGLLQSEVSAGGLRLDYTYSTSSTPPSTAPASGLLLNVQDQHGRSMEFRYEQPTRITQVIDATGGITQLSYDGAGQLERITWPDGKSRAYLHERADLPWAVTGVADEAQSRLATYGYDDQGRAIETQWAAGADHYSASYTTPPTWKIVESVDQGAQVIWRDHYWQAAEGVSITGPNGSVTTLGVTLIEGKPYQTSSSQPAGAGCAASSSSQKFDGRGNLARRDDFNGTRMCQMNDAVRLLATVKVEGLSQASACSVVTPDNASLPINARKMSTQWHPDWSLPIKLAAAGRITTSVYNGQPDPFNGNAIASCAPMTALLPDGKPIAVLCKKVEQSTTDADGHLGFSAALQGGVANRVSTWTYNQYGQVLTAKGPRTSVNDTTTYAYYADTTADHTVGDLKTVTNAAGKVTNYDKYNKLGQLLQSTDANGNVTVNTYDARQHLLTSSVAGETTTYTYDPVGQLVQVTQADGSWVGYEHDDAHRQTAVKDNLGNRIEYQLDNVGSKTGESVKDPAGSLKRSLARVMDALGRIQQHAGRE